MEFYHKPAPDTIIADMHATAPLRVYDLNSGNYIFSILSPHEPGDIPPDIARLPVIGLRFVPCSYGAVLCIDTACN